MHRLWLPDEDCPGLAMARAFGDFCLKDFGLISTPQISYRKLTDKDEFVVLATDGVSECYILRVNNERKYQHKVRGLPSSGLGCAIKQGSN